MDIQKTSVRCAGTPGDFQATVHEGKLHLPCDVLELIEESNRVNTVVRVLSFFQCFPSTIWEGLGWSRGDFDRAQKALLHLLEGHVPDEILNPRPVPERFAWGVRPHDGDPK
ncbi:MAG: hypothetical protein WA001_02675 [Patescibacteria group bacterium]